MLGNDERGKRMSKATDDFKILAATVVLALVVVLAGRAIVKRAASPAADRNPYEYDITEFAKVPPEFVSYAEDRQIPVRVKELRGLAIAGDDRIYVVGDELLLLLDSSGTELLRATVGEPPGCVAVSEDGEIHVGMGDHVEVYAAALTRKSKWPRISADSIITSIAVSSKGVFVADAGTLSVYCYDRSGSLLRRITKRKGDDGFKGFIVPSPYFDVALDSEGILWVVNPGRHEFDSFTDDGSFRSSWKRSSIRLDGFSGCCNPTHMAILPDDSFVTSEKGIARVKVHGASGDFSTVVATPAQFSEDTVGLDLAVDSLGNIWVLDPKERALRIFSPRQGTGGGSQGAGDRSQGSV